MASAALKKWMDFLSVAAKPLSDAGCNAAVAHRSHSGDLQKNGDAADCHLDLIVPELPKNEFKGDLMSTGDASEKQKGGSLQETAVNGCANVVQECGALIAHSEPPGSYGLSESVRQPPTPPPSPHLGTRQMLSLRIVRDCKTSGLSVTNEHINILDNLFMEGYNADVGIHTEDGGVIAAHSTILAAASPVFKGLLEDVNFRPCSIYLKGVPYKAAKIFVRFLYSSRFEEDEMEDFIMHLLVLSHAYCVPSLKRLCTHHWEQGLLTHENVVDILQMARLCDAPRLHLLCYRVVLTAFKEVARTDGWRVLREANPKLEQELVEAVIESDYRKQEKLRKAEDDKVYEQLHDAMEALVHICRDGCRTIGPHDKLFDPKKQGSCTYPACMGLESLARHFAVCKLKVSGGCLPCKRMWQLLELHSRMCHDSACKVPLCGHFRNKIGQHQSKRDETRWRLLVKKVISAKNATAAFSLSAVSTKLQELS